MTLEANISSASPLHRDRVRAGSFGEVAELYDQHRPDYPKELFDALMARCPTNPKILDIGCGTGKVALPLIQRGVYVLGLEPDPKMATFARAQGVPVEIANFETWDPAGRSFDLLVCGAAWHWIDPLLGFPQSAQLLQAGGTLAIFYNMEIPQEPIFSAMESVYGGLEPQCWAGAKQQTSGQKASAPQDLFEVEQPVRFPWTRTLSTDEWIAMLTTASNHQVLPPARLLAVQKALHSKIESLGGVVHTKGETYTRFWRRR